MFIRASVGWRPRSSNVLARWGLVLCGPLAVAQTNLNPVRWQSTYTAVYSEDAPKTSTNLGPGLQLQGGASIVTDPALMLSGTASIRLKNYGTVATNPAVVPIAGNTTYIVEFQYRILSYGTSDLVLGIGLVPSGDSDTSHWIPAGNMVKSAASAGNLSGGAQTGTAASYELTISASADSDVVINRITIFRQDPAISSGQPASWSSLENLPYPRLGKDFGGGITNWNVRPGMLPFQYSTDQIENRLAFNDVIAGLWLTEQTSSPADIRRVRQLNPKAVILPYRMSGEQGPIQAPQYGDISLDYSFLQAVPDAWYVKDSHKNRIGEAGYEILQFLNIYPPGPVVGGQTYVDFLLSFLHQKVFPSGVWDGVFLDNFFAEANIHIPNLSNPALLDFDVNGNGLRDETPAFISEMTRTAVTGTMDRFRAENGDLQLVIGNAGAFPELSLAPYINGSFFECVSDQWGRLPQASAAAWRRVFDAYRVMQATSRGPRINLLEGCGDQTRRFNDDTYLTPTPDDLRNHRLTLGTTLLSDGFYGFDLHDNFTVPSWYDEYSVDEQGNAVEDRSKKGYLGAALTDAVELTEGGSPIFQAPLDSSGLPRGIRANPPAAVSVSNGALILENPVHTSNGTVEIDTNPAILPLSPDSSYLATFDVTVLDTLDAMLRFRVHGGSQLDGFGVPSIIVKGDHSTVNFPFTISTPDAWSIAITMTGGGKVAISNFRVLKGGVGPWRRDFENGLVLVNPFPQPHTFSAADLAGALNRTGIRRIKGTQSPGVNDGHPVTGDLTLGAFDAIILLADRLNVPGCSYSLEYSGQAFAVQGGTGTITITTGTNCPWSVRALPTGVTLTSTGSGVGNGSVTFQVLPNLGGGVSRSLTIADQTFTIEQSAASIPGLALAGSLAQVASEGTWDSSLMGINLGASSATARFSFAENSGGPLMLPLTFPQLPSAAVPLLAASLDRTLNPNAQIVMESTGPDSAATLIGSGQLLSTGNVSGFGIFANPKLKWNAVVPLETRNASKYILAFDNTSPVTTGVAVANLAAQAASVPVIIRDDTGTQIGNPTIPLSALGHTSFMLNDPQLGFPVTNSKRGTIEFDAPPGGRISVLGLRANGPSLTTLPVLANVGPSGGAITHVAYNSGWTGAFYLVNTGNASAQFTLSFLDENGIALTVPLFLPQSGTVVKTAEFTQTLAAGAMLVVNTQAQDAQALVIGSAQLTTTGNISGFEIFRWTTFGQEASVPLETRTPNSFVLVFDDTNGLTTGVALANQNAAAANVTARIYDDAGTLLQTSSINLGSRGHTSFMLPDNYSVTSNKRGMVEFVVPQNAKISAIGLRAKNDGTLTTIPVLVK